LLDAIPFNSAKAACAVGIKLAIWLYF